MYLVWELLQCALWDKPFEKQVSVTDLKSLLVYMDQQTVFGLLFNVIKDKPIEGLTEKKLILEAFGKTERIKGQNNLVNKEVKNLAGRCNQLAMDYLVVKGQTIGCLYPKPELRQAGDIDFLLPVNSVLPISEDYKLQQSKMQQIFPDIQLPERMLEREVAFTHNGVLYELHTSLRGWAKKEHQEVWDSLVEKEWLEKHYVEIDGVKVRTLSPTLNAVYVFIHLFFHFIREGVSLRQLCDWAIVLHYYNGVINREDLLTILQDLDLFNAYCAFGTILTDYLGLPVNEFPLSLDVNDRKWQDKLLKDIFEGGNFGRLHHQSHSPWKYKMETMRIALRNSFRYYGLCPTEVGGMMLRLVKGNLKILFS